MTQRWRMVLLAGVVSLPACSHMPVSTTGTMQGPAFAGLPMRVELTRVPFFPQEEDQCGPGALAMMLTHAGVPRTPEAMREEVYLPLRHGSVPIEMVSAVRRAGLTPQVLEGGLAQLLEVVSQGQPVTILLNVRWAAWPQWHYAVVVGFDQRRQEIFLHSGLQERQAMTMQDFDRQWAHAQRWGLLVRGSDAVSEGRTRPEPTD